MGSLMLYGVRSTTPTRRVLRRAATAPVWIQPVKILAASVLWGTTGTSLALAPAGARPTSVAAVRLVLGGGAVAAVALLRRSWPGRRVPLRAAALPAGALVAAQLCFFEAVDRTGVAVGTVVAIGSSPVMVGALSWVSRGEAPGRRWAVATALALAGCALLSLSEGNVDVEPAGVALALGVGLGYALYILGMERLVRAHSVADATTVVLLGAAALMSPVLLTGDLAWVARPRGLVVAAHLGLLTVAVAYPLFTSGLRYVSGTLAVTLTLAEPLTASLLGVAVLGERLDAAGWAGAGAIAAGLLLLTLGASREAERRPV